MKLLGLNNRCLYGALVVLVCLSWYALLRNTVTLEQLAAQVVIKTTTDSKYGNSVAVKIANAEQENIKKQKKKRKKKRTKKKVYVVDVPSTTLVGRWDCERHYVLDGIAKSQWLERTNDPNQAEAWIYAPDTPTYANGICDGLLKQIRKSAERRRMIQRGILLLCPCAIENKHPNRGRRHEYY